MGETQDFLPINQSTDVEAAVEAMIFMGKDPLMPEQIHELLVGLEMNISMAELRKVLANLMEYWAKQDRAHGRGLMLKKVAGGYMFCTALEQACVVKAMKAQKPIELSKAQIEVLSIIAYRQPITRVDVDEIRGVDSSFAIKRLMQLKLLKILGKSEGLGRPLLYGTTKHFLEFFGLNSLNDLPTLKQFESLSEADSEADERLLGKEVSFVDLFQTTNNSMFSEEIERQSDDALKSLDEALLRVDSAQKSTI